MLPHVFVDEQEMVSCLAVQATPQLADGGSSSGEQPL